MSDIIEVRLYVKLKMMWVIYAFFFFTTEERSIYYSPLLPALRRSWCTSTMHWQR